MDLASVFACGGSAWSFAAPIIYVLVLVLVGLDLSVLILLFYGLKKAFWNNWFGFNL